MARDPEEQKQQELYRDARFTKQYDGIWQDVGKCVFCDLKDKYIILEEHGIVLTISLFAYIDGHMMIIPRRHIRSAKDLTELDWDTIRKFTYIAKKLIRKVHGIKGIQFVLRDGGITAQSTVSDHFHLHTIPFDAPDLSTWNYRQLKHTPLENVALYRQARNLIAESDAKFTDKYMGHDSLALNADLLLINDQNHVLLQERADGTKLSPDYLTIPGGMVDDMSVPIEQEVAREVFEETGLRLDPSTFKLVDSRIEAIHAERVVPSLDLKYVRTRKFLWNTYVLRGFDSKTPLTAGDDAKALVWVDLDKVPSHPRVSPGVKAAIKKALS